MFLYLTEALDFWNRSYLILKLCLHGTRDNEVISIINYSTGRVKFTNYCDSRWFVLPIGRGAPQGIIMGPFYFFVFMKGLYHSSQFLNFFTCWWHHLVKIKSEGCLTVVRSCLMGAEGFGSVHFTSCHIFFRIIYMLQTCAYLFGCTFHAAVISYRNMRP